MKFKIVAILLFCFTAPTLGTFAFLQYQKMQIKKAVKAQIISGIEREELVLLKFTKQESETKLRWEHSKEFEYKEQMYDIIKTEIKNDSIYYWCWWDKKETKLNNELKEILAFALGKHPVKKDSEKRLISFYKSLFYQKAFSYCLFLEPATKSSFFFWCHYRNLNHPPTAPPPETC